MLLFSKGDKPPIKQKAPIWEETLQPGNITIGQTFEKLEKLYEERRRQFPGLRGVHFWATKKKNVPPVLMKIRRLKRRHDSLILAEEKRLITKCAVENRKQALQTGKELEECIKQLARLPASNDLIQRKGYLENVGGIYTVWFKQRKLKPPVVGRAESGQQPVGRIYDIDEFEKVCKGMKLKKGKTIPIDTRFQITVDLGWIKASKRKEFKTGNPAYQKAGEYASRLGYKKKRRTKEDTGS